MILTRSKFHRSFSPRSGTALTPSERCRKRISAPGARVLDFSVEDTGIGISSASLDLLFKPFTQADSTTHRRARCWRVPCSSPQGLRHGYRSGRGAARKYASGIFRPAPANTGTRGPDPPKKPHGQGFIAVTSMKSAGNVIVPAARVMTTYPSSYGC